MGTKKVGYFQHSPLDLTTASIRLVRVLPHDLNGDTDPICCDMEHLNLAPQHSSRSPMPTYLCLSHTWRSPRNTRIIEINSKKFEIRSNLWHFLHAVRCKDIHKYFWIDALCIDQRSTLEKNHQVGQMSRIYSEAEEVIIWLGPGHTESWSCFEFINQFETHRRECSREETVHTETRSESSPQKGSSSQWPDGFWEAYLDLCNNDYWDRAWILQEVALARQKILWQGTSVEMSWADFCAFRGGSIGASFPTEPTLSMEEEEARPAIRVNAISSSTAYAPDAVRDKLWKALLSSQS